MTTSSWIDICSLDFITPGTGVAALVHGQAVAVFRLDDSGENVRVIGNVDPFTRASVLSRGIVGCRNGEPYVASPLLKHAFSLDSGEYLEDRSVQLPVYPTRIVGKMIQVSARV